MGGEVGDGARQHRGVTAESTHQCPLCMETWDKKAPHNVASTRLSLGRPLLSCHRQWACTSCSERSLGEGGLCDRRPQIVCQAFLQGPHFTRLRSFLLFFVNGKGWEHSSPNNPSQASCITSGGLLQTKRILLWDTFVPASLSKVKAPF